MLTWTKRKTEFGYTININNTDKTLIITFGGNLDLYWYLDAKNDKEKVITFEITKENYSLFLLLLDGGGKGTVTIKRWRCLWKFLLRMTKCILTM